MWLFALNNYIYFVAWKYAWIYYKVIFQLLVFYRSCLADGWHCWPLRAGARWPPVWWRWCFPGTSRTPWGGSTAGGWLMSGCSYKTPHSLQQVHNLIVWFLRSFPKGISFLETLWVLSGTLYILNVQGKLIWSSTCKKEKIVSAQGPNPSFFPFLEDFDSTSG